MSRAEAIEEWRQYRSRTLKQHEQRPLNSMKQAAELIHEFGPSPFEAMDPFSPDIGRGWMPLLRQTIKAVLEAAPGTVFMQIKEKFGGLRLYYFTLGEGEVAQKAKEIIRTAKKESLTLCEMCGEPGELRKDLGWIKTLCSAHYEEAKKA